MSDPARPPRSTLRSPIVIGFVVLAAAVAVILAMSMGSVRPASTAPPPGSGTATAAGSAVTSPVAVLPTRVPPTNETSPAPEPTIDPKPLVACAPDNLAMMAGGWGGATGSMGGGATLINVSNEACRIEGWPGLELLAHDGTVIASGVPAAPGEPVAVAPGGAAGVIAVWMNWCGDPPARPLTMRLSLADGAGTFSAEVRSWEGGGTSVPRCDAPGSPSTIGAPEPFTSAEGDIGSGPAAPCAADKLDAFLGSWGAAAGTSYAPVVILNHSTVACTISTRPRLDLLDASGTLLRTGEMWFDIDTTVDLSAGSTAISYVGFANWCIARPALPLQFALRIDSLLVPIAPTSEFSEIPLPYCNSVGETPPPGLFWSGPFVLAGS